MYLVQMELNDDTWHLVKETPRVMGFIGGKADKPAPITDKEADAILQRVLDSEDKPRPKTLFEPGEVVRVIDGPFNDFNGVVEEVNYDKSRLRVRFPFLAGQRRLSLSLLRSKRPEVMIFMLLPMLGDSGEPATGCASSY